MMWFEADNDVTIPVDYLVDGEFVVPDSATYTVRAHDGSVLDSGSMPASANSETLTISAANNAILNDWENRYVKLEFIYSGQTYYRVVTFQLSSFLPITATEDEVRALIGLNGQELPDRDIDLYGAYFRLVDLHGDGIETALTEAGSRNAAVNQAIALKAALEIVDSIPLRALITVRSEDSTASRSTDIDFDAIGRRLEVRLSTVVTDALGATPASQVIFDFSSPTDPFSG